MDKRHQVLLITRWILCFCAVHEPVLLFMLAIKATRICTLVVEVMPGKNYNVPQELDSMLRYPQEAHNLWFINLIQSRHNLTGWGTDKLCLSVFSQYCLMPCPYMVCLVLSIQMLKWILRKQRRASPTRTNGVCPCHPVTNLKFTFYEHLEYTKP